MSWLRDPLLHFLIGGGVLFLLYEWFATESEPGTLAQTIVVDREALLRFMQYRSRAFDAERFGARLDAMTSEQRQVLIDQYVREEALYREALALGLDREDYVIRQRLVQSVSFAAQGFAPEPEEPSGEALQAFYDTHREDYRMPATITFTHVFLDEDLRKPETAERTARQLLADLQARKAGFSERPALGDRFPYHVNYVDRTRNLVTSHFGAPMTDELFLLPPDGRWRGPLRSVHGWHLVMITERADERIPELASIRARVTRDARQVALRRQVDDAIAAVVARYRVELGDLDAP